MKPPSKRERQEHWGNSEVVFATGVATQDWQLVVLSMEKWATTTVNVLEEILIGAFLEQYCVCYTNSETQCWSEYCRMMAAQYKRNNWWSRKVKSRSVTTLLTVHVGTAGDPWRYKEQNDSVAPAISWNTGISNCFYSSWHIELPCMKFTTGFLIISKG